MTTLPSHDRPSVASYGSASGLSLDRPSIGTAHPVPDEVVAGPGDVAHDHPSVTSQPASERRAIVVARASATVEALVGGWLALSSWVVGSGGSHVLRWNDVAVGALLALLAATRFARPALPRTPSASFGLGAWTIVAAFVLSFQNGATGTAPLWNAICCGAALTAAAAWSTTESERATLRRG